MADVNNDGKTDVVVGLRDTSQLAVYLGNGDGTFQNPILTPITFGSGSNTIPTPLVVADVNGDNKPDVVIGEGNDYTVEVHFGNGDGTFQTTAITSPVAFNGTELTNPENITVGDVDGDGHPDVVVGGFSTLILFGTGDGTFAARSNTAYGNGFLDTSPTLVDLNKDGKLDLVIANAIATGFHPIMLKVALGNGDGTFQPETSYPTIWDSVEQILTDDFDGDGNTDVIALSFESNGATFLKGSPTGVLTEMQSVFLPAGGAGVAADLDGDHIADLVTPNINAGFDQGWVDIQYGSSNGKFTFADTLQFTSAVGGILSADFNGDGLPDLLYNNLQDHTFTVLLQTLKAVTTVTVTSSGNPAASGQPITFTATATGQVGTPTGSVTFKSDGVPFGTADLDSNGVATFTTSSLPSGVHLIAASYSGDTNYAGAGSLTLSQTVQNTTVTDLGVSIQPSGAVNGGTFAFAVTIKNNGPAAATNVVLNNALSGPLLFQTNTRTGGLICGNGPGNTTQNPHLVCKLSSFAVGATATLTITGPTSGTGTLLDTANVYALQSDSDHTNDTATSTINVVNPLPTITAVSPTNASVGTAPLPVVITGAGFTSASQVLWNGVPLATQFVSSLTLDATIPSSELLTMRTSEISVSNPAPGGGTSSQFDFVTYRALPINVKDMVYDPVKQKIFATVDLNSPDPNKLYEIDPFTGTVDSKTFIGSGPNRIAISDDGQVIYVGIDGALAIRRFDPANLMAGNQFTLGLDTTFASQPNGRKAAEIAVMPGNHDTVAVTAQGQYSGAVNLYDNGVVRPNQSGQTNLPSSALTFGGNPSTLYGAIDGYSPGVNKATIDANGLTFNESVTIGTNPLENMIARHSVAVGNKLFFDDGVLFDPVTNAVSLLPFALGIASDSQHAYRLQQFSSNAPTIEAIDPSTLSVTGAFTLNLPSGAGVGGLLTRWGQDGFAFPMSSYPNLQQLVFVRSSITGVQPQGSADVGMTFSAAQSTASIGDTVGLTANLFNAGPDTASDSVVTIGLPTNWNLNSATPSIGNCSNSVPVICKLGLMASGTTATISISLTAASAGDSIFAARIESPEADANQTNNGGLAEIVVSPGAPLNPIPTVKQAFNPFTVARALPEGSPDSTISVQGTGFVPGSVALWNGQPRTTTYSTPQALTMSVTAADLASYGEYNISVQNPGPGGGASASVPFAVVRTLNVKANTLVFDVFRNKFYAAMASGDAQYPNTIVTIDPATGVISNPIAVNMDPRNLIITGDGSSLYFSTLNGSTATIQRIALDSNTLTTVFSNTGQFGSFISVGGLAAVPGRPDSIVVYNNGFSGSLFALDNGIQRPGVVPLGLISQGTPVTLAFDSSLNLYTQGQRFAVNGSGVSVAAAAAAVPNGGTAFNFDGGHIFYFGGAISNATTYQQEAQLQESGSIGAFLYEGLGDASAERAYYRGFGLNANYAITIFETQGYQQVAQIDLTNPTQIIHWDTDKLAVVDSCCAGFSTPDVSFVQSPSIAGVTGNPRPAVGSITPDSSPLNGADLTVTITGVNFVPTSQVKLNGASVTTGYTSATQLSATIPSASLSQAGANYLTVSNPSPAGGDSNQMIVKIVPPSISVTTLNPSSQGNGHLDFPITVNGSNFTPDSVVMWNGSPRVTQFVNSTQLTATIKAADVATQGSANVSVTDWIAGTSNSASFNIGPAPQATLSGTTSWTGPQKIGVVSPAITTTLTNTGNDVLQISAITVPAPFHATSNCPSSLAPTANCTISITVTPTEVTFYPGTLTIDSNSIAPPTTVNLGVQGGAPRFLFQSASATYPAQRIFSTSASQLLYLSNQGNYPMTLQSVKVTGDFAIVSNACPTVINTFVGCGIGVVFHPTHGGATLNGSLVVTADDSGTPHVMPLIGTVIDISLSVPRPSRPSRSGVQGHLKTTAQVELSGYSDQAVHLSCGALPTAVTCQFGEQDFLLNGNKTVDLSLVNSNHRSSRLSPSVGSKSVRLGVRQSQNAEASVEVIVTSGEIHKSIVVPMSLP